MPDEPGTESQRVDAAILQMQRSTCPCLPVLAAPPTLSDATDLVAQLQASIEQHTALQAALADDLAMEQRKLDE